MKSALTKRSLVKRLRAPNIYYAHNDKGQQAMADKLDAIGEALAYLIEKKKLKRVMKKARRK